MPRYPMLLLSVKEIVTSEAQATFAVHNYYLDSKVIYPTLSLIYPKHFGVLLSYRDRR